MLIKVYKNIKKIKRGGYDVLYINIIQDVIMFLFESISYQSLIMWILVIFVLIFFNEISRLSKYVSIFFYIVLPIILTIFV